MELDGEDEGVKLKEHSCIWSSKREKVKRERGRDNRWFDDLEEFQVTVAEV